MLRRRRGTQIWQMAGSGGASFAIWDQSTAFGGGTSELTVSGGGKIVTETGSGAYWSLIATKSASSGLKYFEVLFNTNPGSEAIMVGIGNSSFNNNNFVGQNNNGVGYDTDANILWLNGVALSSSMPHGVLGDTACIAVDLTNKLFWASLIHSGTQGNWNGSPSANPATGTGGISFSTIAAGPYFPAAALGNASAQITANFGASAYSGSVPSGFGNW